MASAFGDEDVELGDILAGKYLVQRMIGRGGMGIVVEAREVGVGERVAIKILRRRYCDNEEALARFHREARAATQIRGEHSVRLIDVGATRRGAPFIVMELLEGGDLSQLIRSGPVSVSEAVLLILQACEGMAEVHAHGIIHRDLKPGNLFVTRRLDGSPLVKVLDFGIAKSVGNISEVESKITMTFVALGTPLYMSPEQIRCAKSVDARADIWSLGGILYELLAGRPVFGGNTVTNIAAQVLEATPTPLNEVRAEVPAQLARIIARALSKKAEDRFPDVATFAQALAPFAGAEGAHHAARAARLLRGEARGAWVAARPVITPEFTPRATSEAQLEIAVSDRPQQAARGARRPAQLGAIFGATVLFVMGGGWTLWNTVLAERTPVLTASKGLKGHGAVRSAVVVSVSERHDAAAAASASASAAPSAPPDGSGRERSSSAAPGGSASASASGSASAPPASRPAPVRGGRGSRPRR